MTFTIRTRGAPGLIVAEYLCPEHGRFEETVERDEHGDPCPVMPCPHEREDGPTVYICLRDSELVISAPKPKTLTVATVAAVRGGDMKDRPPGMLDTRPLAEGMPMREWRKKQDAARQERRHQQLVAKGLKQKRIQVG